MSNEGIAVPGGKRIYWLDNLRTFATQINRDITHSRFTRAGALIR